MAKQGQKLNTLAAYIQSKTRTKSQRAKQGQKLNTLAAYTESEGKTRTKTEHFSCIYRVRGQNKDKN